MTTETIGVTGGIDTHSNTHHAAALDEVGRLLGTREFQADPAGCYHQLPDWLGSFGTITRVGVEGTGCYGAGVTRFLRRHRIPVIEVNRPDRRSRRVRGKSDSLDAESAARRALAGEDQVTPKDTTTIVEAIRVLRIARTGAVKSRTAAFNQLKDLIITAPDSLRETLRDKTLHRVAVESARLRPDTSRLADPTQATKLALRTIAVRVAALNTEISALDTQLGELVTAAAPRTLALLGVGTEHAAQLLITAGGNPERLRSEASFAALCAASPIPASSGKTNRHRLNPAGDREANRALYMITLVRLRYCPDTQAYISDVSQKGSPNEKQSAASNVMSPARPTTRSAQTSPRQPLTIYRTITKGSHERALRPSGADPKCRTCHEGDPTGALAWNRESWGRAPAPWTAIRPGAFHDC